MMDLLSWPATKLLACVLAVYLSYALSSKGIEGASFTFQNECGYTVWPGLLANGGWPLLADGGFELGAGQTRTLDAPVGWSGRFWGRTGCSFSSSATSPSAIACESGDCGGKLQCSGIGATPPATLAEFTLAGTQANSNKDFYDVSLVDGYNIPIAIAPSASSSNSSTASPEQQHTSAASSTAGNYVCQIAGCIADLNLDCPAELQVRATAMTSSVRTGGSAVVGCKSACEAFQESQYCCTGSHANPNTCQPSSYSQLFKQACPRAYSYAYDDASSTFTCTGSEYSIIFCPSSLSQKNGGGGALEDSGARISFSWCWRHILAFAVLNFIRSFFFL